MKTLLLSLIVLTLALPSSSDARERPRSVKIGQMTLVPAPEHTRVSMTGSERLLAPSGNVIYTVDGIPLDLVVVYGGFAEGRALGSRRSAFGARDSTQFKASWSPEEIMGMYEELLRPGGASPFARKEISLVAFGGVPGFKCDFAYERSGAVSMRGVAYGAVVDKRLYLIVYSAPATYFFEKRLPQMEALVSSIEFSTTGKGSEKTKDDKSDEDRD